MEEPVDRLFDVGGCETLGVGGDAALVGASGQDRWLVTEGSDRKVADFTGE